MGRQRNIPQKKKQEKSPEKELNEMEASILSDAEFKVMVIRILNSMKKDLETIKIVKNKEYLIWNDEHTKKTKQ